MHYDFETIPDRHGKYSMKYEWMRAANPDAPADTIPFSIADMEFKNPPQLVDGLKRYMDGSTLGYCITTDHYRQAICDWMSRRHGWKVEKEWILDYHTIVTGLFDIVDEFVGPDQGVILMTPVYGPFYSAVGGPGRRLVENPLLYRNGRFEVDFEDLERKARDPDNKLLILCSPHNPVGRLWTREELTRIGRICIDNGVLIAADEIHADFIMPGGKHHVFATLSEEFAQNCIIGTSPSKSFNMAGLQASSMIVPNREIRERLNKAHFNKGFTTLTALAYHGTVIAYTECEEWFDRMLDVIVRNRDLMKEYLEKNIPEIRAVPVEATYLQWLDCSGLGMTPDELTVFMQKEALLFFSEGPVFGDTGRGFERWNLACPTWALEAPLERLKKAVDRRMGRG